MNLITAIGSPIISIGNNQVMVIYILYTTVLIPSKIPVYLIPKT